MEYIRKNILFVICIIGIIQALIVGILKVSAPLLSLFFLFYLSSTYFKKATPIKYNLLFWLLIILLSLMFLQSLIICSFEKKEILYHLNLILSLIFAKTIAKDLTVKFALPFKLMWIYMIISLIIYLFFWDSFAPLIHSDDGFLGLRSSGFNRSFGLILNPLSNAYFLLIMFFITYFLYEKGYNSFKILFVLSMLLAITRGAIVSLGIFFICYLFFRRKWKVILGIIIICTISYFLIEPVQIIVDSIIYMEDSQGSAQGHKETLADSIEKTITNPLGIGFSDYYTESWIFTYGVTYGYMGIIIWILFFGYIMLKFLQKRRFSNIIILLALTPVFIIIPFHRFNLPISLLFILIYMMYYNRTVEEKKSINS